MSELAFDKEGNPFRFSRRTKKLRPRGWKNAGQRGTCAAVLDGLRIDSVGGESDSLENRGRAGVIFVNRGPKIDRCFSPKALLRSSTHLEASIDSAR